jgi:hypothetical protein
MEYSELHTLLNSFEAIGLDEMESVSLMNRLETKYVFSARKLPYMLDYLSGSYKVLEIDNKRTFPYHTTYLDTPDYLFYTQQVRGKLNRHKIRYRIYESTGLSFLEIKKKTNKNRTIKWRIQNSLSSSCPDLDASLFIKEYIPYNLPGLQPVLINGFSRITLVGVDSRERVTLDFNLSFTSHEGRKSELPFLAIAELKRERHSCQSQIGIIMKQRGIQPNRFSKYCIGSTLIRNMPRKNTLKSNLLLINKIENEYNNSSGT